MSNVISISDHEPRTKDDDGEPVAKACVISDSAIVLSQPDFASEATSELLFGECVEVLQDYGNGLVKAKSLTDKYIGCVPEEVLSLHIPEITHKVCSLRSFVYEEPNFKTPAVMALSFLSQIELSGEEKDGYAGLADGGWIWKDHLIEAGNKMDDYVETAQKFIGTPYLWAGRTSFGLDCSSLVQLSLLAAGIDCPRDSKDQLESVGTAVEFGDTIQYAKLQRGDLVFFEGHVGFMLDDNQFINATARHMEVCVENIDDTIKHYKEITGVRRIG